MTSPERKLAAIELAERARVASRALAASTSDQRARALRLFADQLGSPEVASAIAAANEADLRAAAAAGKNAAFIDRLRIDGKRLAALATAVRDVANLPDPVGEVVEHSVRPNGLRVDRVRAPLGVILMIYE
ncbi:MAG: gamma-glutamyl-phosphate reductase, partial [Myxococcales bacterium]